MADGVRSVLLVGVDDAVARQVVVGLDSVGLQFSRAASLAVIGETVSLSTFALIIIEFLGDRSSLSDLREIEARANRSGRRMAALLLCPSVLLGHAEAWLGRGIGRVVPLEASTRALREAVVTLLGVAPRLRIQMPVRLAPVVSGNVGATVGRTENISSSGMLVTCPEEVPVGGTVRFEIVSPDGGLTIRGSARVVREVDPVREGTRGMGARFVTFLDAGADSLRELMSRQSQ